MSNVSHFLAGRRDRGGSPLLFAVQLQKNVRIYSQAKNVRSRKVPPPLFFNYRPGRVTRPSEYTHMLRRKGKNESFLLVSKKRNGFTLFGLWGPPIFSLLLLFFFAGVSNIIRFPPDASFSPVGSWQRRPEEAQADEGCHSTNFSSPTWDRGAGEEKHRGCYCL